MKTNGFVLLLGILPAIAWGRGRSLEDVLVSTLLFGNKAEAVLQASDTKPAFNVFMKRQNSFKSPEPLVKDGAAKYTRNKRVGIQRAIYSISDSTEALAMATDFTSNVKLFYEWEGMSDGPLAEAQSAEAYLKKNSQTPIAAYVHLFIGHRMLCAAKFSGAKNSEDLIKDAIAHLETARASHSSLIVLTAADLIKKRECYPN